jgi:LysM repeat protein
MKSSTVRKGQTLVVKPAVKAPATTTTTDAPKSDATPADNTGTDKKADNNDVDNTNTASSTDHAKATAPTKTTSTNPVTTASSAAKKYTYYTVKRGDNLSVIANKYKVNINDIKKWNNLRSNNLQAGQKLKIQTK